MSVVYCHEHDQHIDTDFDAEHFDDHSGGYQQLQLILASFFVTLMLIIAYGILIRI